MTTARDTVRFTFLLGQLSSYLSVCLEELAALPLTDVSVVSARPQSDTPYDVEEITPADVAVHRYPSVPDRRTTLREVRSFNPDVLVISGWERAAFRHAARRMPPETLRVLLMDNQWLATPKQLLGVITSGVYVRPLFDIAFLPGERQAIFATKLRFPPDAIWRGMNSCDHDRFSLARSTRTPSSGDPKSFVFVGRLVAAKGLVVLAEAYQLYRDRTDDPWPLRICGAGPLEYLFAGKAGVELMGFVQPAQLPAVLADAACLVMPSVFEPWGVAIHEATAAGLPVICSNACGAAPHLVEDGINGYVVTPGSAADLANAMVRLTHLSQAERDDMGLTSTRLSQRYTPSRWASLLRRRSVEALVSQRSPEGTPAHRRGGQ